MEVYIQSKSGDLNSNQTVYGVTLRAVLQTLRERGGYCTKYRDTAVFVPFEEIQYIKQGAKEGSIL